MIKDKKTNLISDEQLLRFSDAVGLGASFDQAFTGAGFSSQNKNERNELQKFFEIEQKLKHLKEEMVPTSVLLENILKTLSATSPAAPVRETVIMNEGIKSPYGNAMDRMVHTVSGFSWKIGAPIAVLFLTLSTMIGISAKRDSAVVLSPDAITSTRVSEMPMAMNTTDLNVNSVNSQEAVPSPAAFAKNAAPTNRTMLMNTTADAGSNEADSTPETVDGVLAMLYKEADNDMSISQETEVNTAIDDAAINVLEQPYDETNI